MEREGGYVDHPMDRGGPTNYGITQKTLSNWRNVEVTKDAVRGLKPHEAMDIYYSEYWLRPGFDHLPLHDDVVEMVFDMAVMAGPHRAVQTLQEAVGAKVDGLIGPKTRKAVTQMSQQEVAAQFMAARIERIGRIVADDPSQAVFAAGWNARLAKFVRAIPYC